MAPGSVLVKQRGSQHCLLPGSWRIGLGREKWENEGGKAVCPSLSLPGAPWRGWQVRRGEENREVVRACALPRCGAVEGTTHQGDSARPGKPHQGQAGGRGRSPAGFCVGQKAPRGGGGWPRVLLGECQGGGQAEAEGEMTYRVCHWVD